MRVPVASLSRKLLSALFAVALTLGLVPTAAFALEDEVVDSDDAIVSEVQAEEREDRSVEADAPTGAIINQEMPLDNVVAQTESTRTFFLAQTLESARGIPMVSAKLPIDKGESADSAHPEQSDGEDGTEEEGEGSDEPDLGSNGVSAESTVVGSFTSQGLTYAVEPGGESVAVVAADYGKLPDEQVNENILVIPPMVSADGADAYSVTRIADGAFSGLTKDAAGASATREETSGSFDEEATSLDPSVDGEGAEDAEELEGSEGQKSFVGIVALGIPTSVTSIEDGAFTGSDTLQYLVVSDDNPTYASFDGALYSADLATLRLIPEGRVGAVRIAPSATDVDPEVFSHCPLVDAVVADADSAALELFGGHFRISSNSGNEKMLSKDRISELVFNMVKRASSDPEENASIVSIDEALTYAASSILHANGGTIHSAFTGSEHPHITHTSPATWWSLSGAGKTVQVLNSSWTLIDTITLQTRTDCTFLGWSLNEADPSRVYTSGNFDFSRGNLIANWKVRLKWNPNGGWWGNNSTSTGSQVSWNDNTTSATSYDGASLPVRTGYTFSGWNTSPSATSGSRSIKVPNSPTVYYAVWTPNSYTVSFNANGGTGGQSTNVTATYDAAMPAISSAKPTRAGYTFCGWYDTNASSGGTQYYTASGASARTWDKTAATTLYARWSPNTYTIAYDANGGTVSAGTTSYNIESSDFSLPTSGTRMGYTFSGWTVSGAAGAGLSTSGVTTTVKKGTYGNLTATAQWTPNTYAVSFNANGGSGGQSANVTATYDAAMPAISSAKPTRAGYTFCGWYDTNASSGGTQYYTASGASTRTWNKTAATTLYARWTANPYTAHLHANDGTGAGGFGDTVEHAVTYDAAVADVEVPKRYGYAFSGYWTKDPDGSKGELYFDADGAYVKDAVWKGLSDVDLYACWTLMGDLEVPISSPSNLSFTFDRATGQASASDGSSSSYGLIRSSMPEEVPVASVALEALRGPDGTSVPEKLLGQGNPEECAMEVVFSAGAPSSKTALLRFASAAGSAKDETLWEFPLTERPLIPSATSVASGTTGDGIVADGLGNLARAGELSLSYALKTLSGFDVYKVPLADASEDVARIVFTVDLTGVAQERF